MLLGAHLPENVYTDLAPLGRPVQLLLVLRAGYSTNQLLVQGILPPLLGLARATVSRQLVAHNVMLLPVQTYQITPQFLSKEWIMDKWDAGYYITAIAGAPLLTLARAANMRVMCCITP